MAVKPFHIQDARQGFAQRFQAIARRQGVPVDGLLELGDLSSAYGLAASDGQSEKPPVSLNLDQAFDLDNPNDLEHRIDTARSPSLIVPGLLGDSVRQLVAPLMCAREQLTCIGYDIDVAWVNGRTGCARNAALLREQVLRAAEISGSAINIIAYSKGCADCLHMLGEYPDTHEVIRSLVSLAGVTRGTPLAQDPPWLLRKFLQYTPIPGVPFGDGRAIVDMSYRVRQQWLADHALPPNIYLANVVAAPQRSRVSRILKGSYDKLALVNPANDSQVIDTDTLLPGGALLAIVNADHWAIALPVRERLPLIARLLVDKNSFPRDVLLRALLDHLHDVAGKHKIPKN